MRSPRRTPDPRTAAEILANPAVMALLSAIASGAVVRGEGGGDLSAAAPHLWQGRPVGFGLRRLSDDDLIRVPLSGPPKLTGYGAAILARAAAEPFRCGSVSGTEPDRATPS